jgi:hypothetical protein
VVSAACLVAAFLVAPATVSPAPAELIDRVLAVVNRQVITLSDAQAAIRLGLEITGGSADPLGTALTRLIDRQVLLDEVNRYTSQEPDAQSVNESLEAVRARFESPAAFVSALEASGMSEARLRGRLRDDLRIESYLQQRFEATPASQSEVEQYYRDNPGEFTVGGALRPFPEMEQIARARASRERRHTLIADWVERLRRRADLKVLYLERR